jgi:hypothetical protein
MGAAGDYVSNAETRKALADGVTDRVTSFTNAAGEYIPSGEKLQSLRDTATGSMRSVANLTGEYIPNAAKQGTETFWKSTEGVRGTFTQFAQGAGERISGFHVAVGSVGTILAGAAYGGAKRFGKKKAEEAPAATDKPDANAEAKPGNTNLTGDNVSAEKEQPIGSGEDAKKPSSTPEKEQTVAPHQEPEKHLDVDHQSAPIESRKHTSSSASHEIPDAPKVAAAKTSNTTASAHEEVKPRATSATSKSKSSGTWRKFADGVDSLLKKFGKLLGRIR